MLINVKYAGVNPVDTYIRSGAYGKATPALPFTPGYDGSGVVQQIGDEVTQVKVNYSYFKVARYFQCLISFFGKVYYENGN